MHESETIKEGAEVLTCQYCGQECRGMYHSFGLDPEYNYRETAEEELKRHEEHCLKNPNCPEGKLHFDILRCQGEARIYHCLNCQHYQKKCSGTKN